MKLSGLRRMGLVCVLTCLVVWVVGGSTCAAAGVVVRYGPERTLPTLPGSLSGVAVDARGDVFELVDGFVVEFPAGAVSAASARLVPGLYGDAIAVDPGGDVLVGSGSQLFEDPLSTGGRPMVAENSSGGPFAPVGVDGNGDAYFVQDSLAAFGTASVIGEIPLSAGAFSPDIRYLRFSDLTSVYGLAVSAGGDVYASDGGELLGQVNPVQELRAGATHSAPVPFADLLGPLAVDPWGGVYGLTSGAYGGPRPGRVVALAGGACQAKELQLPFAPLNNPQGLAVDGRGDVFVADSGDHRVVWLPAIGRHPSGPCPLTVSRFALTGIPKRSAHLPDPDLQKPTLRFELAARTAGAIKRVQIELAQGLKFTQNRKTLTRAVAVMHAGGRAVESAVRVTAGQLVISLKTPGRRIAVAIGRDAITYDSPCCRLFFTEGFPTYLLVTSATGHTIQLMA